MTPQELKISIIHLAMRGKLVKQQPDEGTGREFYNSIIEEKKSLKDKAKKATKAITKDIIPFDIPDSWCWARFGDVVSYNMGKTPPRAESQWWKNEIPWVTIADMPENGLVKSTKEGISRIALNAKFGNKISKAGTMIMSFKLSVGRVSILDIDAVHNEAIISIYPYYDVDNIFQSYLFYLLPIVTQYGDSKNAIKGKTLNDRSISNLMIPLPPLAEQKRIIAKFKKILPYIDLYEKVWSKLEDYNARFPVDMQKSLLQYAVQGKLVEQYKHENPVDLSNIKHKQTESFEFNLPETWKIAHIESVAQSVPSKQYQILESSVLKKGLYPVVSQSKEYIIGFSNNSNKLFEHNQPVIVFGDHTTEVKYIDFDFIVGADGVKIFLPNTELLDTKFFYYVIYYHTIGLSKAGKYSRHYKYIKNKPFPLPPLAEQKRIVAKLEELLPLCERLK